MKLLNKILFLVTTALFVLPMALSAQDLEGVEMWSKLTRRQVTDKYGNPERYKCYYDDAPNDSDKYEDIYYDNFCLTLFNSTLYDFWIEKPGIKALTKYVSGGVQVGDSIKKLDSLEKYIIDRKMVDGELYLCYMFTDMERYLDIYSRDGVITLIKGWTYF